MGFGEFIIRVLFAGMCGLLVGLDREIRDKPMGAQAYILVAMSSAALMTLTLTFSLSPLADDKDITLDPTRLIQGIVGGIGFLGAGAIMTGENGSRLRGVGSGAAVWGSGAIGVASGLGYLKEAAFLSVMIFVVLNLYGIVRRAERADDAGDADHDTGDPG